MKTVLRIAGACVLGVAFIGAAPAAQAAGCIKGAVVGGVAGHVAGHHGLAGAAVGCAVGHHMAHEQAKRDRAAAEASRAQQASPPPADQPH